MRNILKGFLNPPAEEYVFPDASAIEMESPLPPGLAGGEEENEALPEELDITLPAPEPEPLDVLLKSREIPKEDLSVVKSVVRAFLELEKPSRDAVIQFVQSCAEKLNAPTDDVPGTDAALAEKVAALERQNRELMARLEAIEKEDAEKETAGAETGAAYISRYR